MTDQNRMEIVSLADPEDLNPPELKYAQRMRLQPYQRRRASIGRGRDHWQMVCNDRRAGFDDFVLGRLRKRGETHRMRRAIEEARGPATHAFVNKNRWVAFCGRCGSREVQVVDPDDPRFYCLTCYNIGNGGYPRPVKFPPQMDKIEDVLLARRPYRRDYFPAETVGELEAQNKAHQLPARASAAAERRNR